MKFRSKNPRYESLRKKWSVKTSESSSNLFDKHLKNVAVGSLGGLMLLSTPASAGNINQNILAQDSPIKITGIEDKNAVLAAELKDKLPSEIRNLSPEEEARVIEVINKNLRIKAKGELEGIRLNRNYALIGGEQHLYRYPGDNVFAHAESAVDWVMYGGAGIAPGLGAWGYFSSSKEALTETDIERERWYVVVQTFLTPGFAENTGKYRDFFKYRKMIVVNPKTGQAVVGDIADAGPAEFTGKSFGGSPEVMHEIGLAKGPRKGEVLIFFVEDPENKVPLGPIKIKEGNPAAKES